MWFAWRSGDFKTNEKKIMKEIDDIQKKVGQTKKGGMQSAVDGTEAIREWVSKRASAL